MDSNTEVDFIVQLEYSKLKEYISQHLMSNLFKAIYLYKYLYFLLYLSQIKGLYRGATPSFVGMAFESSLLFGIYSQTKQALQVFKQ